MKKTLLLAPLLPVLAMTDASAACSTTIENTSNASTTTLAANSSNTCIINSGSITVTNNYGWLYANAILVAGLPSGFSGVSITNNGSIISNSTGNVVETVGIAVDNGSSISDLRNNGSIILHSVPGSSRSIVGVALDYGIVDNINIYSSIANFNNYGIINVFGSGNGAAGFDNSGGTVTTFVNDGTITAEDTGFGAAGIVNETGQTISNITNNGTISATNNSGRAYGIYNGGLMTSLTNTTSGTISGTTNGIYNDSTGTITSLNNSGIINGGMDNKGTILSLTNSGVMSSAGVISNSGTITSFTNSGIMAYVANNNGWWMFPFIDNDSNGTIGSFNNTSTGSITSDWKAISNGGTISTFNNSGSISSYAAAIQNWAGSIGTFTNSGSIASGVGGVLAQNADFAAIKNGSLITTLINSGTISGGTDGISNNTEYGANGRITTLTNTGTIAGGTGSYGIRNQGTITTLNNAQNGLTYTGALPANYNIIINSTSAFGRLVGANVTGSAIFGLSNLSSWTPANYTFTGVLSGLSASNVKSSSLTGTFNGYAWTLFLENGSSNVWDLKFTQICLFPLNQVAGGSCVSGTSGILAGQTGDVINAGTITASTGGIVNSGTISTLNNSGSIESGGSLANTGTITTFNNSGSIRTTAGNGIENTSVIGSITNTSTGTLTGAVSGINNNGQIGTIFNNGIITGEAAFGEGIGNGQTITTITNNGTITAANHGIGNDGFINSIENNGTINVANKGAYLGQVFSSKGIYNGPDAPGAYGSLGGKINSILNTGTISVSAGGANNDDAAINNAGTIGSITNSGTLRGFVDGVFNESTGRITTLTNQGSITGGSSSFGIKNQGTITTLNNVQNNLTYTGVLPTNYNVILNSTASFGRLLGTNVTGSAIFGLSNLSSWTPTNYTFTGVLQGLTASNIATSSLSGNSGGYKWSLFLGNGSSTVWDLKFESTAIGAGSTSSLSNGSGSSPITVAGGTLEATSNSTITAPITLTGSSNSTINASGKSTVFTSAITSSGSGKLVLADSSGTGAITLNSPNNVIAGGVAITSGTVAVGDGNSPNAKLQADVTLSPSSTLKGHGTIVGAIANNGGTVRPGGSIGTLAVSGSYDQTALSTLSIELDPSQSSQLSVYGTLGKANLNGTLDIVATPGTYGPKKYTMVTTTGGLVGSFSKITSNFSSYSNLYSAVSYDTQNAYFTIYGFTLADTQSSIVKMHSRLVNVFDYQTMMVSNSLQADCPTFDKNGGCISISGRYSSSVASSNSTASEASTLTAAIKLNDNLRVGAYVDQTISEQTLYGIKVNNTLPTFGLFGAWGPTPGNSGWNLRASIGLGSKDLTITRPVVGSSEAGMGSSSLVTKGARAIIGYDVPTENGLTISPYVGARYTNQKLGSYTESATADVTAPLSYANLVLDRASVIGGSRLSGKIGQSFGFFTDLGVEYDFRTVGGGLKTAVGDELTPVAIGPNSKKVRPVASIGFYHDIATNQRVSFSANYRMEQFQSTGSASTMLTYALGFGESRGGQVDNQATNSLPSSQKSVGDMSGIKRGGEEPITVSNDEKASEALKDKPRNGKPVHNTSSVRVVEQGTRSDNGSLDQVNLILPIPQSAPKSPTSVTTTPDAAIAKSRSADPAPQVATSLVVNSNNKELPLPVPRPNTRNVSATIAEPDSTNAKSSTLGLSSEVTGSLAENSKNKNSTESVARPVQSALTQDTLAAKSLPTASSPQVTASLTQNSSSKDLTPSAQAPTSTNMPSAATVARPLAATPPKIATPTQAASLVSVNPSNIETIDPEKRCIQQAETLRTDHVKRMSGLSSKALTNYKRQNQTCYVLVTIIPMGNPAISFVETLFDPTTNTLLAKIEHRKDGGSVAMIEDKGYKGAGVQKFEEVKSYIDQKMDGMR